MTDELTSIADLAEPAQTGDDRRGRFTEASAQSYLAPGGHVRWPWCYRH
jgi:hypothetical protein